LILPPLKNELEEVAEQMKEKSVAKTPVDAGEHGLPQEFAAVMKYIRYLKGRM